MVRAVLVSVVLALASADSSAEQASLLQTQPARNSGKGGPTLKDADLLTLLDTLIADPQSMAKELVGAEASVQQALVQRANEKPRRRQILDRVLGLPTSKKLELLQAAKTSPEVARLFHSLSQQTQLNLIEMAKAESVDAAVAQKDGDWFDISAKASHTSSSKTTSSITISCEGSLEYFGNIAGVVTVADPDLGMVGTAGRTVVEGGMDSGSYCESVGIEGRCTYIHYAYSRGTDAMCVKPAPPDYCHRYKKVTYSDECESILDNLGLTNLGVESRLDADLVFNENGILKQCADHVLSVDTYCWGPPADATEQCECPV